MATTFITSLFCLRSLGIVWPEAASLALNKEINTNYIIGFSIVFGSLFPFILIKYLLPLGKKQEKE